MLMYCINYYNSTTLTCNYTYVAISINLINICTPYWFQTPLGSISPYTPKSSRSTSHNLIWKSILDEYCHFISSLWSHQETNSHYLVRHFLILCYLPKELRKSEIFLMLPVMTSMYSRLAQSCWIGLWWLWIWPWLWGWCDIVVDI